MDREVVITKRCKDGVSIRGRVKTALFYLMLLALAGFSLSCQSGNPLAFMGKEVCNCEADKDVPLVEPWPEWIGAKLAATPPMGWNSWNGFGVNVNEDVIKATADAMVSTGLKNVGYQYIVIDDYWHGGRDKKGYLYPDPNRFPNGMKALADYVHSKGLKFGIYSDAGIKTCGEQPASYCYEEKDAQTFAKWGVDFLKYDYCFARDSYKEAIRRYTRMGDALKATGRPIVFSVCEWGDRSPWLWSREAGGHMWRVSFDVKDVWDLPRNVMSPIGILTAIDVMANLEKHAGPGGWNDPDMLVIGLRNQGYIKGGGCTDTEYRTQMSMWCMMAAPLMITCNISKMDDATKEILMNPEIIAIDQDRLGKQGFRVARKGATEVWAKPLTGRRLAVALLNRGEQKTTITAERKDFEVDSLDGKQLFPRGSYTLRDVWAHKELGTFTTDFSAEVEPHECKVMVLTLQ